MNRRNFLANTVLLLITTSVNAKKNLHKTFDMYIDESGNMGDAYNPFVMGALIIDSSYNYTILNKIKKESGFNLSMSYKSSNKYKLDFLNPLLQEFFQSEKIKFSALVFPNNINEDWPSDKKHRLLLYKHNYKKLLRLVSNKNIKLNIYLSTRISRKEDEDLKQFLEKKFNNINIQFIRSKNSNSNTILSDFTDVLTGSVYGDNAGTGDITKQKVIDLIKLSINAKKLNHDINFKGGKFTLKVTSSI